MLERLDLPDKQMAIRANTILKVLNGSSLNLLDILLRESVQNSLDAACEDGTDTVDINFDPVNFNDHTELENALSSVLNPGDLKEDELLQRLYKRVREGDPLILVLKDTGTTGLTGSVRRDSHDWGNGVKKNFDNLVYQFGINEGKSGSGGSYGFGKSIYYRMAKSGLLLFYSKCHGQEKLAFCMISEYEQKNASNSTGISWWGETYEYNGEQYSAPVTNSEVIGDILQNLKLNDLRFSGSQTGTLIGIVAPDISMLLINKDDSETENSPFADELELLQKQASASIQRWYWPRMSGKAPNGIDPLKQKSLRFYIKGKKVELDYCYGELSKLLEVAAISNTHVGYNHPSIHTEKITHEHGGVHLGTLAFSYEEVAKKIEDPTLGKIMMIRDPKMVIFEKELRKIPEKYAVRAVFLLKSDSKVYPNRIHYTNNTSPVYLDNVLRDSESATHSEWKVESISNEAKWFKGYVRKVLGVESLIEARIFRPSEPDIPSLYSDEASLLGDLLLSFDEGSIEKIPPTANPSPGGPGKPKPTIKVISREFPHQKLVSLKIDIINLTEGSYKVTLKAKGGREEYTVSQWEQRLGDDFPLELFSVLSVYAESNTIISSSKTEFTFSNDSNSSRKSFFVDITVLKSDTLISLGIDKLH
jgi:hypothetical protein